MSGSTVTLDVAAILYPPAPGAPTVWPSAAFEEASVDHPVRRRADRRPDDPAAAAPQRRRIPGPACDHLARHRRAADADLAAVPHRDRRGLPRAGRARARRGRPHADHGARLPRPHRRRPRRDAPGRDPVHRLRHAQPGPDRVRRAAQRGAGRGARRGERAGALAAGARRPPGRAARRRHGRGRHPRRRRPLPLLRRPACPGPGSACRRPRGLRTVVAGDQAGRPAVHDLHLRHHRRPEGRRAFAPQRDPPGVRGHQAAPPADARDQHRVPAAGAHRRADAQPPRTAPDGRGGLLRAGPGDGAGGPGLRSRP